MSLNETLLGLVGELAQVSAFLQERLGEEGEQGRISSNHPLVTNLLLMAHVRGTLEGIVDARKWMGEE